MSVLVLVGDAGAEEFQKTQTADAGNLAPQELRRIRDPNWCKTSFIQILSLNFKI